MTWSIITGNKLVRHDRTSQDVFCGGFDKLDGDLPSTTQLITAYIPLSPPPSACIQSSLHSTRWQTRYASPRLSDAPLPQPSLMACGGWCLTVTPQDNVFCNLLFLLEAEEEEQTEAETKRSRKREETERGRKSERHWTRSEFLTGLLGGTGVKHGLLVQSVYLLLVQTSRGAESIYTHS